MKNEVTSSQRLPVIRNRYFLLTDMLIVALAGAVSFYLRLGFKPDGIYLPSLRLYALTAMLVKPLVFYLLDLYQRFWRYSNIYDLYRVALGTLAGSLVTGLLFSGLESLVFPSMVLPTTVPFIDWLLTMPMIGGTRLTVRLLARERLPWEGKLNGKETGQQTDHDRVLVMGAGDAGALMVEEMLHNPKLGMVPVGFLDDNRSKTGLNIYDVPVLGTRKEIPALVNQLQIDEVLIAMPTAPGKEIRGVVKICQQAGVRYKTIPGIYELIGGKVSVTQARDVSVNDLLRRDPIRIRDHENLAYLNDCVVLVTGAGGSIGSELCRQIGDKHPQELLLLGHGENSIYHTLHDLREQYPGLNMQPLIADIRDQGRIRYLFHRHQPDVVFHAAAHKHVPLMEMNVLEAVTNNILGTKQLLDAAIGNNVGCFVLVSTDKAVKPVNVMGVTKRFTELLVQDAAYRTGMGYLVVRFGNVLGSRGSVVPFFKQQIQKGGPVTVTHPDMKRFFMTIPEAVQLILQAAGIGKGEEIFVLDMGEQVKILELAEQLIRFSGYEPEKDIAIEYSGIRPGEKLSEELFYPDEKPVPTPHEKILAAEGNNKIPTEKLEQYVRECAALVSAGDKQGVHILLKRVIPEYNPLSDDLGESSLK
jgi:FlaA1/EpsC-like NDP-sugar epimerase